MADAFFSWCHEQRQRIDLVNSNPLSKALAYAMKREHALKVEVFKVFLRHCQKKTERLNNISDQALKEKDNATCNLLQWFVDDQEREENTVSEIISKLKLVKDDSYGLLMIDNELGSRTAPASIE